MSLLGMVEEGAANAILPGSGVLVRLARLVRPLMPWLLLTAGVAALLLAVERHGAARGAARMVARYQPVMDRALKREQAAAASIVRLRAAIDTQNAATRALATAEAGRLAQAQAALAAARAHDASRAATIAKLTASAARPIAGPPCEASAATKGTWK